ncbi:MAG: Hpt domain-containing protein [Nitrospinae bacterium]|nr:Hpt domain-containing protein [Nitrospinota bacterium]
MPQEGKVAVRVEKDLAGLIPDFLRNREEDIRTLGDALAKNDFKAVWNLGHNLKGAGGSYGFAAITRMGADIEKAASAGDAIEVQRLADELANFLSRVEITYY